MCCHGGSLWGCPCAHPCLLVAVRRWSLKQQSVQSTPEHVVGEVVLPGLVTVGSFLSASRFSPAVLPCLWLAETRGASCEAWSGAHKAAGACELQAGTAGSESCLVRITACGSAGSLWGCPCQPPSPAPRCRPQQRLSACPSRLCPLVRACMSLSWTPRPKFFWFQPDAHFCKGPVCPPKLLSSVATRLQSKHTAHETPSQGPHSLQPVVATPGAGQLDVLPPGLWSCRFSSGHVLLPRPLL